MVGALAAVLLADEGFTVSVVEHHAPQEQARDNIALRVSAITRASQRLLRQAGVWEAIVAHRATAYEHMYVWDGSGNGAISFDAADIGQSDLGHIIENNVIQGALWKKLEQHDNIRLFCPAEIEKFSTTNNEVRVELSNGDVIAGSLLIGADGSRSKLREMAGIGSRGWAYDQHAFVTTVKPATGHASTAWQKFMPSGPLAFLPIDTDQCSIVWSTTPAQAETLMSLDDEELAATLSDAFDHRLGDLTVTGERGTFPLQLRHTEHYISEGLALVGDAAHVVHPLAGQGVNLGFGDVADLVPVVAEAKKMKRPPGAVSSLRAYERAARARNVPMLGAMDGFKRLFSNEQPLLRFLRNSGMKLMDNSGPVKRMLIAKAMGLDYAAAVLHNRTR